MVKFSPLMNVIILLGLIIISSIQTVRDVCGTALDILLGPLAAALPLYMVIIVMAAITGLYTTLIQKYTIDYEKLKETQAKMVEFQKEYRAAQLAKDEKQIRKLEAKKDKMMIEQLEASQEQFKPMVYMILVTAPIFYWMLYKFPLVHAPPMVFPYLGTLDLVTSSVWIFPTWLFWYLLCSFAISTILRKVYNIGQ